jgi:hypothetical protein
MMVYISGVHLNLSPEVGIEESIVNSPLVRLQSKRTTTQKVRLDLNS